MNKPTEIITIGTDLFEDEIRDRRARYEQTRLEDHAGKLQPWESDPAYFEREEAPNA